MRPPLKNHFLITLSILAISSSALVHADTATGSLTAAPGSAVNLNASTGFAYYGGVPPVANGAQNSFPAVQTDNANVANFSGLTAPTGTSSSSNGSQILTTYTNASTSETSSSGLSNVGDFNPGGGPGSFSLSTVLFASSETLTFYLSNYDTTSDLSLALGATTLFTLNNATLPTTVDGQHTAGTLTLTVNGTIGDSLTFSDVVDLTGVSDKDYSNVGINAVTASAIAVPEPSSFAFLGAGALALLAMRRRSRMTV
jgi:hypothetical protein